MDLDVLVWILYVLLGCLLHSSADNDAGVCETHVMELHFGTRIQVQHKLEVYYTWCGREFCYKTRQKVFPGGAIETFSEWRKRQICCQGYKETNPGKKPIKCEPICAEECINANCTGINNCTCLAGYEKKTYYECTPICVNGCVNGKCTGPNICTCNDGYKLSLISHLCMPECDKNCTNGFCIVPNKCQCFFGYMNDKESYNICNPKCNEDCINGVCTAPNNCSCNLNYELDSENKYKCNPICEHRCINGYCSKPNECMCYDGYGLVPADENNYKCNPICEHGCVNGYCSKPNVCTCYDGYSLVSYEKCENGTCNGPDICSCVDGFKFYSSNTNICYPVMSLNEESVMSTIVDKNLFEDMEISTLIDTNLDVEMDVNTLEHLPVKFQTYSTLEKTPCDEINSTLNDEDFLCFSSENELLEKSFVRKCQYTNSLRINYACPCNIPLECHMKVDNEDYILQYQYNLVCFGNTSSVNGNVSITVAVHPTLNTNECHWCYCSSDVVCDETQFLFSLCALNSQESEVHKQSEPPVWFIFLLISLSSLIIILIITSLVVFLLWKRHRRVDYALQYKESQNCNSYDNAVFERTRELISDDDSEEET